MRLRQYGWTERYSSQEAGWNTRLDEIQAAVLRAKLKHLDQDNAHRRSLAQCYEGALSDKPVVLPKTRNDSTHVYHLYVVRSTRRDEMLAGLRDQGIGAAIHYPVPIHGQPAYANLPGHDELPVTEALCGEILSLPMYPELSPSDVHRITHAVAEFADPARSL